MIPEVPMSPYLSNDWYPDDIIAPEESYLSNDWCLNDIIISEDSYLYNDWYTYYIIVPEVPMSPYLSNSWYLDDIISPPSLKRTDSISDLVMPYYNYRFIYFSDDENI